MMKKLFFALCFPFLIGMNAEAQSSVKLIDWSTPWSIYNTKQGAPAGWNTESFNAQHWGEINTPEMQAGAEVESEEEEEHLFLPSYGASKNNKITSSYFRKSVRIADVNVFENFQLNLRRDAGIIVYVNGNEVYRNNMPEGLISNTTLASTDANTDRFETHTSYIPATAFHNGENIVAVETHKHSLQNPFNNFNLQLVGVHKADPRNKTTAAPTLTRGPYLQIGTPNSITIHWKTQTAANNKVSYGTSPGNLNQSVENAAASTMDHIVTLTGLTPNTKYYYSIGTTTDLIQGDEQNSFVTSPLTGSTKKINIWALGDYGSGSSNQMKVRDAYSHYMGDKHTDVWITMGDNAYLAGLDQEFQTEVFDVYGADKFKNTVYWPAPGNHDYNNNPLQQTVHSLNPYFTIFTLPTAAEAGGIASGTEDYYSFNYGNVHFLALDAYGLVGNKRMADTTGAQAQWIKQDLLANTLPWVIAYWHHPPYSKGSHDSDLEGELADIRTGFLPFLEKYNVDLVLNGHSHSYERSYLIKGMYVNSEDYDPKKHAISSSTGFYDGSPNSAPYIKDSKKSGSGIIYCVSGSGGQLGGQSAGYPHKIMAYSNEEVGGSSAISIEENRMDFSFVAADSTVKDHFVMFKDVNKHFYRHTLPGKPITLTASWIGDYKWSTGETTRSITVAPFAVTDYYVQDEKNALKDTNTVDFNTGIEELSSVAFEASIFPNPSTNGKVTLSLTSLGEKEVSVQITNLLGQEVSVARNISLSSDKKEEALTLPVEAGYYLVTIKGASGTITRKVEVK